MVRSMALLRCRTIVTKSYSIEEWIGFKNDYKEMLSWIILSCTNKDGQFEYVCDVLRAVPELKHINVIFDRNQGTCKDYIKLIERFRLTFPTMNILTGIHTGYSFSECLNFSIINSDDFSNLAYLEKF